ncbi:MAG: hypothetical protein ACRD0J_12920, partial [Acidimicrobiales bacterium]
MARGPKPARRRRLVSVGTTVVALVVVALVVAPLPAGLPGGGRLATVPGATASPEALMVARAGGLLQVISPVDGTVVRSIRLPSGAGPVTGLAVAPGSTDVYLSRPLAARGRLRVEGACHPDSLVLRASLSGGPLRTVATGSSPAVSPDGRWLAYASECPSPEVTIQGLGHGPDHVASWPARLPPGVSGTPVVTDLAWSPDSTHLAVSVQGATWQGVEVLDTGSPASASNPSLVGPPAPSGSGGAGAVTAGWDGAVWQGSTGGLAVIAPSCAPYMDCTTGSAGVVSVDPTTHTHTVLVPGPPTRTGPGPWAEPISAIAIDPAGDTLVTLAGGTLGRVDGPVLGLGAGSGPGGPGGP